VLGTKSMDLKTPSLLGFGLMIVGIVGLAGQHELFGHTAPAIVVQILAVGLMVAARLTFGSRSFHAAASPTEGRLVTSGPYALLRHPIYSAVLYFVWAAALDYRSPATIGRGRDHHRRSRPSHVC
jgi:protein-S-isoprenylcysteine O-methyltransferase Ste14